MRKLDDENVYRKLQGHWIIEMSEMIATANAKSIEEIKSFLSRQKEVYKIPYETHPEDRPRQCVFGGTSNAPDFLPLDRTGNRSSTYEARLRLSLLWQFHRRSLYARICSLCSLGQRVTAFRDYRSCRCVNSAYFGVGVRG